MIQNKQINKAMSSLLGDEPLYDVLQKNWVLDPDLPLEEAQVLVDRYNAAHNENVYSIASARPAPYCEDINLALSAAKRIAGVDHTFVLSLEDGTWKAAFGNYGDCAEYSGGNPAYCVCMATLKFMGKL